MSTLAYKRWRQHKNSAKGRGIEFQFTFEEWVKWWEAHLGPDWLQKRGKEKGKYVMSREGDKGTYIKDNVECKLHEQNNRDQKSNGTFNVPPKFGEKNGNSKLTDNIVIEIFYAKGTWRGLARQFNVDKGVIKRIKTRCSWKHITSSLP